MGQDDLANKLENIKVKIIRPRIEKRLIFKLAGNLIVNGCDFFKQMTDSQAHNATRNNCCLRQ
jgi:hypothetical protein